MTKTRTLLGSLAAAALLASMATTTLAAGEETEAVPIEGAEGISWQLVEQTVDGTMSAVPDGVVVTLLLEDGEASGIGGCNNYFGGYTLDGSSLTFDAMGATQMFCEGPAGEVEAAYLANLALVASWASDGSTLSLADAEGAVILEYAMAPEATILGGWVASGINNGADAVVTSDTTPLVTAIFDGEGRLTGFDGCNDYFTDYTVEGDQISISDAIGSTRMACESDALSEQSQQYYAALLAATTWSVSPTGMLELRDGEGALQVSYIAAMG